MKIFEDFSTSAADYSTGNPWTDPRFKYPQSFTKAELDAACTEYGLGEWMCPNWDNPHEPGARTPLTFLRPEEFARAARGEEPPIAEPRGPFPRDFWLGAATRTQADPPQHHERDFWKHRIG